MVKQLARRYRIRDERVLCAMADSFEKYTPTTFASLADSFLEYKA